MLTLWLPSLVEAYHKEGPYGAKGMGEVVTNSAMAAIGNAVEDALGIRLTDLPLTAERVYAALNKQRTCPELQSKGVNRIGLVFFRSLRENERLL